jgi:hypothetical protein
VLAIPTFGLIASFSCLVPVIAGFWRLKTMDRDLRLVVALVAIGLLITVVQLYLAIRSINNLWIGHMYNLVEYAITLLIFSDWEENPQIRAALRMSIIVFGLFWVVSKIEWESLFQPAALTTTVARMAFTLVALRMLYRLTEEGKVTMLRDPRFWVCVAILVSATGDLMFYSLRNLLTLLPKKDIILAFRVHWFLMIVVDALFLVAFLTKPNPAKPGRSLAVTT